MRTTRENLIKIIGAVAVLLCLIFWLAGCSQLDKWLSSGNTETPDDGGNTETPDDGGNTETPDDSGNTDDKTDTEDGTAPDEEKKGTEGGYGFGYYSGDGCESPPGYAAFSSDKDSFDINDVTLTFYYGDSYSSGVEADLSFRSYPIFDVYFTHFNQGKYDKYLVKHVEENFVSEKYRCFLTHDYIYAIYYGGYVLDIVDVQYNHSEEFTIPKEVFIKESGVIFFRVKGDNVRDNDPRMEHMAGIDIYYKIVDGRVILSDREITDWYKHRNLKYHVTSCRS